MKLFKQTLSIAVVALSFNTSVLAGQVEIDQIEQATATLNIDTLSSLTQELSGYDLALAQYRLALSANLKQQPEVANKAIDQAITLLEDLQQAQPDNVEYAALLAQVYGYKIAIEPQQAMIYGNKSMQAMQKAESLEPNNPRVLLFKGISEASKPAAFGGSRKNAIATLSQSINAFESDVHSDYHWGLTEAYTWRGMLHQQSGNQQQANADWQQALTITPNYGWASELIAKNQ